MLKAGIVGLPNVGKSSLFNALTKASALSANYPFATIEPNVGQVVVQDTRLDKLASVYLPKKTTYAAYQFIDIAGLVKGAASGEGLGNKFLSHIREVAAIVEVVRCFKDSNVLHVENSVDPVRDAQIIDTELALADLEIVENRIAKIEKKARTQKDKEAIQEVEILTKVKSAILSETQPDLTEDERFLVKSLNLLTLKPLIYIANISDDKEDETSNANFAKIKAYADARHAQVLAVCVKLEEEVAKMNKDERIEYLEQFGFGKTGLDQIIESTYSTLNLSTYFTAGSDECRAWTFKTGSKAPDCAGIIHTDFKRGFIKAEVVAYADFLKYGSINLAKENGALRLEGKEYLVKDGDIITFRFNV